MSTIENKQVTEPTSKQSNPDQGKTLLTRLIRQACYVSAGVLFGQQAFAGPEGGQIVGGEGGISQSGATTTVQQQSQNLAIEWQQFNVAAEETVRFVQPSADAAVLNRILDQNPSQIFGSIEANGRVFLINPNGLIFGQTAKVNVGSLVASTLDISTADFMAGNYTFKAPEGGEGGMVVNRGLMKAATGGSINLIGGTVANEGLILADYGQVNLGAGRQVTLDFDGDGLIRFQVDEEVLTNAAGIDSAVSNSGQISAEGGSVLLTAQAARDVFSSVVNNEGVIRAGRIENQGGVVRLVGTGGLTANSGAIDAGGRTATDTGGTVEVLGDKVALMAGSDIDASGPAGGGTVLIGGDYQGSGDTPTAQRTYVDAEASIRADATEAGDGGKVIVWADEATAFHGSISAKGGAQSGDGGFVEVSGKQALQFDGFVDTSAVNGAYGMLLLDPTNLWVVSGTGTDTATDSYITVAAINNSSTSYTLQADNDIFIAADIVSNYMGVGLTAQAGNDIYVGYVDPTTQTYGGSITTVGGNVTLSANDPWNGTATGGGTVHLGANIITDGLQFNQPAGNVQLSGAGIVVTGAALISTQSRANDGVNFVELAAPVIGDSSGTASLTINTYSRGVGGDVTLQTVDGLSQLWIDATGDQYDGSVKFGGNVNVDSLVTQAATVFVGGDIAVLGDADFGQGGKVEFGGGPYGNIVIAGNIDLSGVDTFAWGDLTLDASGLVQVGWTDVQGDMSIRAAEMDFTAGSGSVHGQGALRLESQGGLTYLGGNGSTAELDLTGYDIAAFSGGFAGVTVSSATGIITQGDFLSYGNLTLQSGSIQLGHDINAFGSLTFDGPVLVQNLSRITSNSGAITFSGNVNAGSTGGSLLVEAATGSRVTFYGDVTLDQLTANTGGYDVALLGSSNTIDTASFYNDGGLILGDGSTDTFSFGSLTGNGGPTKLWGNLAVGYLDPFPGLGDVFLEGNSSITLSSNGTINSISGDNSSLDLAGGDVRVGYISVGSLTSNVGLLSVDGGIQTQGNADFGTGGSVVFNTYSSVTAGGDINLSGAQVTAAQDLYLDAGGTLSLGNTFASGYLSARAGVETILSGNLSASYGADITGNVLLASNVTISGGGQIWLANANITGAGMVLTLNARGSAGLGDVGSDGAMDVNLTGVSTLYLNGDLNLLGDANFSSAGGVSAVNVLGNSTITTTAYGSETGAVDLTGARTSLEGSGGLTINSADTVAMGSAGVSGPLAYLIVNSTGTATLGQTVRTAGDINLDNTGSVALTGNTTFTSTSGGINLNTAVDGNAPGYALTVTAPGAVTLGSLGQNNAFGAVDVAGGAINQLGSLQAIGNVAFTGVNGITMAAGASTVSGGGIKYTATNGHVYLGQLQAGSGSNVTVYATGAGGDILSSQPGGDAANVSTSGGGSAYLEADYQIGSYENPLVIATSQPGVITLDYGAPNAYITNSFSATLVNLSGGAVLDLSGAADMADQLNIMLGAGLFEQVRDYLLANSDAFVGGTIGAGRSSDEGSTRVVDWSAFSMDLNIFGVMEPGIRLPDDQLEVLSDSAEADRPVLAFTGNKWQLLWDFERSPSAKSDLWRGTSAF